LDLVLQHAAELDAHSAYSSLPVPQRRRKVARQQRHREPQHAVQHLPRAYDDSGKHTLQAGASSRLGSTTTSKQHRSGALLLPETGHRQALRLPMDLASRSPILARFVTEPGSFVNQTEGVAQVPAQTAGRQIYRAFYLDDTFRMTNKLTLNLGLRYELTGTWSERFNRLTFWNPRPRMPPSPGCGGTCGLRDRMPSLVSREAFVAEGFQKVSG